MFRIEFILITSKTYLDHRAALTAGDEWVEKVFSGFDGCDLVEVKVVPAEVVLPDEERDRSCGCPHDYHLADCPIRTG